MALTNIFKKKPSTEKPIEKPVEKPKEPAAWQRRTGLGLSARILKTPHISEKASDLVKKNQYVFNIYQKANKTEVKRAIEDLYGVEVLGVRVINIPRKKRRVGKAQGWKEGYKKAIVKIKEGQKIEVLPR